MPKTKEFKLYRVPVYRAFDVFVEAESEDEADARALDDSSWIKNVPTGRVVKNMKADTQEISLTEAL
jgi:hypothetical protein